jgi:hypothetical protein
MQTEWSRGVPSGSGVSSPLRTIVLELAADGLYRFVSSSSAQQCQPGRGHQDFRQEPCT